MMDGGRKLAAHNTEMTVIAPTTDAAARSPAAERMRRSRQRRRDGMRCVRVELRETEIDALIRSNLLTADARNDLQAIRKALYAHLEDTLGANPWRISEHAPRIFTTRKKGRFNTPTSTRMLESQVGQAIISLAVSAFTHAQCTCNANFLRNTL